KTTKTDNSGAYVVQSLPQGRYQVVIEQEKFNAMTSPVFDLANGQAYTFDAKPTVAGEQTTVKVTAENNEAIVEQAPQLSTSLSEEQVDNFGLNGRNFSQFTELAPGVSNQSGQDEGKVGVAGSAKFIVNGGRSEYNTFEIDGSDVLNTSINASRGQGLPLMVYPSIDAIEEMNVLTSNYNAKYGKSASGTVEIT